MDYYRDLSMTNVIQTAPPVVYIYIYAVVLFMCMLCKAMS